MEHKRHRLRDKLKRHAQYMQAFMEQGFNKQEASSRAFAKVQRDYLNCAEPLYRVRQRTEDGTYWWAGDSCWTMDPAGAAHLSNEDACAVAARHPGNGYDRGPARVEIVKR